MPSGHYDLRAATDSTGPGSSAVPLRWPATAGNTSTVRSDLGWWLQETGRVPDAAIDLARVAGGAYLADRLTPRPASFTRTMDLTVAVTDPDRWSAGPADTTLAAARGMGEHAHASHLAGRQRHEDVG